jgi:hypothetical protein
MIIFSVFRGSTELAKGVAGIKTGVMPFPAETVLRDFSLSGEELGISSITKEAELARKQYL